MGNRILALDGGGTWALLQAKALQRMFDDAPGWKILSQFDLAVANSGGSIVLAGLIKNMRPSEILAFFTDQKAREGIFKRISVIENLLAHIPIFPRYSAQEKLAGLTAVFGDQGNQTLATLPELDGWPTGPGGNKVRILITSFDYDSQHATLFRSYNTPLGSKADSTTLVQAVHASSNAPISFFDAPAEFNGRRYWDGAMAGLNNPVMAGLTDLLVEGVSAAEISILSIGTGTVRLLPANTPNADAYLCEQQEENSITGNIRKATTCILDDPPDQASYIAHVVLSAAKKSDIKVVGPLVRLNPAIEPVYDNAQERWTFPAGLDAAKFQALTKLQMDAVEQVDVELIKFLGDAWINGTVPNQPIQMHADLAASNLGDKTFQDGMERWRTL